MKMIIPGVEWWPQKTGTQQVARVGRICYKSKAKQPDEKLSEEKKRGVSGSTGCKVGQPFLEERSSLYAPSWYHLFLRQERQ